MTKAQATAEVFWTAFEALRPTDKQAVLRRMLQDESLRQDLLDLTTIASRASQPSRTLSKYLQGRRQHC